MVRALSIKMAAAGILALLPVAPVRAHDIGDRLSIGGLVAGGVQCQQLSEGGGKSDACRGALPIRPHLSFRPTARDEIYTELAFVAGNGLNNASPFELSPWAADLEDDVRDINGRGRDYLLTAWYRHDFQLGADNTLGLTLGLIDSADFLDGSTFANDEYTQFMNEALVNSPQVFLPAYDLGAAVQWDLGAWSLRAVYMNVGKQGDDEDKQPKTKLTDKDLGDAFDFLGAEIGIRVQNRLGEGIYRFFASCTSEDFVDPSGKEAKRRTGFALSFDQELGDGLGAFLLVNQQDTSASVVYEWFYAGGLEIQGHLWGRERDKIGLGVAYLRGGNRDIERTGLAEGYYRLAFGDRFGLTADLQYMRDDKRNAKDPRGFIFGLRADVHF